MSKNLTRKGLAFGAIVALGASLFSAAPAFAADELTLAPKTGTAYKTIEGEAFTLLAGLAPATAAGNTVQLKYQVVTTATLGSVAIDSTSGADTTSAVAAGTNTKVYKTNNTPTVGYAQTIALTSSANVASGTPETAAVTAFFDANSNDALDAGEYVSAARTITWVDAADVVATVELTQPSEGDLAAKATVALADINQEQLTATTIGFYFTTSVDGVLPGAAATNTTAAATEDIKVSAALASGKFSATSNAITALTSSSTVKVTAYYVPAATTAQNFVSNASGATTFVAAAVKLGSVYKAATARTIASIVASTVADANTLVDGGSAGARTADVRLNSPFTVSAVVKDATPKVVASVPVSAKIEVGSAVTLSSTVTVTVNGTTYSTNASLPTALALTSDADGVVKLAITTAGFTVAANKNVKVTLSAQGYSDVLVATPVALAYTVVELGNTNASNERSVTKGTAAALNYQVIDQFKQNIATGYRLVATTANTTGTPVTAGATYATVTDGKASFSLANAATGIFTVAITAEKFDTVTSNWGAQAATAPASINVNVIAAQTDVVALTITHSGTNTGYGDVASAAEKAVDTRVSTVAAATYSAAEKVTIAGTVSQDITAVARKGASVTIAAPGVLFSNAAGTIFAADSITVAASSTGTFTVYAISNIAGSFTVTATSGAASKTATVKFNTLAANASAIAWATLPAQAQAGRSLDLAAVVTDKWGNAVSGANVNFTNSGVGYVQSTVDVATDANGKATGRLIVLQNDLGTSYLSATLNIATDVVVAKSVEFGLTDVDVVAGGHRVFVNAEFAKGRTVTVTIDGKRVYSKVQATDNAVELAFTQKKAGAHTVTVRISGGIVATERVTTN